MGMTDDSTVNVNGAQDRHRRAARRDLRRQGQRAADPPGRRGAAAAARQGTHATKTRGEVSGGGKKPYRQKGTGRARQGSIRAPQFTGGGVAHGPEAARLRQRTPKKMKAAALRGALSDRAANEPRVRCQQRSPGRRAADQGRAGRAGQRRRRAGQAGPRGLAPR